MEITFAIAIAAAVAAIVFGRVAIRNSPPDKRQRIQKILSIAAVASFAIMIMLMIFI